MNSDPELPTQPTASADAAADPTVDAARARAEELIAEIRPALVRFVRGHVTMLPSSEDAIDDVVQETCVAVLAALPKYVDRGNQFTTFAFAIALNKVRDAYRQNARLPHLNIELPDGPDPEPGPEEAAERRTDAVYVSGLLRQLPETAREIVLLRIAAGLSVAETAGVLGMSESAVRVAQHRALKRLREIADITGRP